MSRDTGLLVVFNQIFKCKIIWWAEKKLIYKPSKLNEKIWGLEWKLLKIASKQISQIPALLRVKFSIKLKHQNKTVIIILSVEFKEYSYYFNPNVFHNISSSQPNEYSRNFSFVFSNETYQNQTSLMQSSKSFHRKSLATN